MAWLYPALCDPMDYTVHKILQAWILEWVAVPFSRGSSQLKDQTWVSCIVGRFFTMWATREAQWSENKPQISCDAPVFRISYISQGHCQSHVLSHFSYLLYHSQPMTLLKFPPYYFMAKGSSSFDLITIGTYIISVSHFTWIYLFVLYTLFS